MISFKETYAKVLRSFYKNFVWLLNSKNRYSYIDSLRGIAVLGVVLIHNGSVLRGFSNIFDRFIDSGKYGVQLFFILSAFSIYSSIEKANGDKKSFKSLIKSFFTKRFLRIAPMFYLVIGILILYNGLNSISLDNFLAKILFIDQFRREWVLNGIIGVEWSIGVEVIFYCVAPFLFLFIKNAFTAFMFLLFSIGLKIYLNCFYIMAFGEDVLFQYLWFPSQLPSFSYGILAYYIVKNNVLSFPKLNFGKIIIIFPIVLYFLMLCDVNIKYLSDYNLVFFLLLISISSFKFLILDNRILQIIGKISFSVYLLHLFINHLLKQTSVFQYLNPLWKFLFSTASVLLVSIVTFVVVEKIFIDFSNNYVKRWEELQNDRVAS